MHDVGKILTTIATMSTEELANVSETIRPSGTEASTARNCGDNVDSKAKYLSFLLTGPEFKWKTLENGDQNPYPFMRFLMGVEVLMLGRNRLEDWEPTMTWQI